MNGGSVSRRSPGCWALVPLRLARYFSMSRAHQDPGGFRWIVRDVARLLPGVIGARRPVSWKTFRLWRHVQRAAPAFPAATTP